MAKSRTGQVQVCPAERGVGHGLGLRGLSSPQAMRSISLTVWSMGWSMGWSEGERVKYSRGRQVLCLVTESGQCSSSSGKIGVIRAIASCGHTERTST